jgi:hypothetical protein
VLPAGARASLKADALSFICDETGGPYQQVKGVGLIVKTWWLMLMRMRMLMLVLMLVDGMGGRVSSSVEGSVQNGPACTVLSSKPQIGKCRASSGTVVLIYSGT